MSDIKISLCQLTVICSWEVPICAWGLIFRLHSACLHRSCAYPCFILVHIMNIALQVARVWNKVLPASKHNHTDSLSDSWWIETPIADNNDKYRYGRSIFMSSRCSKPLTFSGHLALHRYAEVPGTSRWLPANNPGLSQINEVLCLHMQKLSRA